MGGADDDEVTGVIKLEGAWRKIARNIVPIIPLIHLWPLPLRLCRAGLRVLGVMKALGVSNWGFGGHIQGHRAPHP